MKAWEVKHEAYQLVWHIRLAAIALEHGADIPDVEPGASKDIQNERARAMNLVSEMGADFVKIGHLLRCEVDGSVQGIASELIKKCDLALEDLKVNALREHLTDQAREEKKRRSEKPAEPEDHES